ncbi:MAG: hypothetical protein H0U54_18425 [Acidobacteria bacterium]|nr:hypothetical protein [Acidobacteriota bacterium]
MNRSRRIIIAVLVFALANIGLTAQGQQRRNAPPTVRQNANMGESRLTGVYRLNVANSDDPQTAAERAFSAYAFAVNQNVVEELTNRLTSPAKIAVERRGSVVSIASTRAPRITFEADGRERTEPARDGHTVRTRAVLQGEDLIVSSGGSRDNEFSVTFSPIEQGRRLRVTRRIFSEEIGKPVIVQSVYDKISPVARWSVYGEPESERTAAAGNARRTTPQISVRNRPQPQPPVIERRDPQPQPASPPTSERNNEVYAFTIPDGTQFAAVLNNDLGTAQSNKGDRFTMTVRSPEQYEGAIIEGYVSRLERAGPFSGRSEMTLDFSQIRLRDGRTTTFAGFIESVRVADGEDVRVDSEGTTTVEDSDNRTNRTAQRAGIGAAVGAIIGAIAGGGKGAAIGAVIGAGAGAGSVYAQGRDDLELSKGTELNVRTSR